ncbi:MAG: FAD-dependent oxidoreductase [Xanthomonadaceae bacterium]|nr:FAD-dependent oxidoreductase [Xanthomonadaceae bacterium]
MKPLDLNCTIEDISWLTPTIFQLSFKCTPEFDHLPGQFMSIIIPGAGPQGRDLRRAYSIASSPGKALTQLCIRKIDGGPGTSYLGGLKPGSQFKAQAPFGHFVYKIRPGKNVCFISTGTGISPFRSILGSKLFLENRPKNTLCLFGTTNTDEVVYDDEIKKVSDIDWVIALSRSDKSWNGFKGRVTDFLRAHDQEIEWSNTDFYLCGNGAMIDEVKQILVSKNVQKESILQEIYYKPKGDK